MWVKSIKYIVEHLENPDLDEPDNITEKNQNSHIEMFK